MCFSENSAAIRMATIRRIRILVRLDDAGFSITDFSSFATALEDSECTSEEKLPDEDIWIYDSLFCVLWARDADLRPLMVTLPFGCNRISPTPSWKS